VVAKLIVVCGGVDYVTQDLPQLHRPGRQLTAQHNQLPPEQQPRAEDRSEIYFDLDTSIVRQHLILRKELEPSLRCNGSVLLLHTGRYRYRARGYR
jgi:hypothetical protein